MRALPEIATILIAAAVVKSEYVQPANPIGTERFNKSTLIFASVYARHGSRSPFDTFPKDPCPFNDLRFWPDGVGRLTKTGKTQAYNLGRQLKSRYGGFINNQFYYDNETIFQSNKLDRDLTSSQLIAAGMYPPVGFQIWNADLLWQPIGVWVADYDVDDTSNYCKIFREQCKKVMDALNEKLARENGEFFREIADLTGIELSKVPDKIGVIYQIIQLGSENNCPRLEWADTAFMNKLFPLVAEGTRASKVGNEVMTALIAGPALEHLIAQLINKTLGTLDKDRKLSVLACHDTTITSLLGGLGINELLIPDPASSLIFELHNSPVAGYVVQVLYFNQSSTIIPTLFEIPGCPHPCSLVNFTWIAERVISKNDRTDCLANFDVAANLNESIWIPRSSAAKSLLSFSSYGCILLFVVSITNL